MKKYKVTFTTLNPTYFDGDDWVVDEEAILLRKKWNGKEITLLELEDLIGEFKEVIFDGETIEIYNDYNE